jgi:hypothetical protein
MRRDIEYNPHKYLSETPDGVLLPPNHLIPTENFSYFISRWDVVSLAASIGWCKTNKLSMPVVFTLSAFFFFSFFF